MWLGLLAYRNVDYSNDLWWQFVLDGNAPRFLRASAGLVVVSVAVAIWRALQGWGDPIPPIASPADLERVRAILAEAPLQRADANLALLGDKRFLFSDSGRSLIMYGVQGRSWIAMGEPVGLPAEHVELLWQFRELADRHEGWVAFYQVPAESMATMVDLGLSFQKLGEQALVPLRDFALDVPARKGQRYILKRNRKAGYTFEVIPEERVPAVLPDLQRVSEAWMAHKNTLRRDSRSAASTARISPASRSPSSATTSGSSRSPICGRRLPCRRSRST